MNVDSSQRNVLITHQFVTGASQCDSEEKSVGGTDNVDADVFEPFDYVALGHIHRRQKCGSEKIWYCGTPLKYSFSEMNDVKSLTILELDEVGTAPSVRSIPLTPLHDMAEIRGIFSELTDPGYYADHPFKNHYLRIVLTDETDIPDAVSRLRLIYPNLMCLEYDNTRTRMNNEIADLEQAEQLSMFDLFSLFYEEQNGSAMSEEQRVYMQQLIEKTEEESI
jgi:exonuclease SbcD